MALRNPLNAGCGRTSCGVQGEQATAPPMRFAAAAAR